MKTDQHVVEHVAACTSTIDVARRLLDGRRTVTVTADHQTTGRGRRGRTWFDTPGSSVLASVGTSASIPASALDGVDGEVASGIADALVEAWPDELEGHVSVKAPNDVLIAGSKVAGVLVTTSFAGDMSRETILSVGLNVEGAPDPTRIRDDAPYTATSLREHVAHAHVADARELVIRVLEDRLGALLQCSC